MSSAPVCRLVIASVVVVMGCGDDRFSPSSDDVVDDLEVARAARPQVPPTAALANTTARTATAGSPTASFTPSQTGGAVALLACGSEVTAVDDVLIVDEDRTGTVNVLANDCDSSGHTLTARLTTGASHGQISISGGILSYRGQSNFNGTDSLTYTASDGRGNSATAMVSVTVRPVNDRPTAVSDQLVMVANTVGTIDVVANDSDVDGDALSVTSVTAPRVGRSGFTDNIVRYVPNTGFTGQDSFQYTISDGHGGTATSTVFVTVNPAAAIPVANDDAVTTAEDAPATVAVLANDSDPSGGTLTIATFTQPAHGTVAFTGGTATYAPEADYHGPDAFEYTVRNAAGAAASARVDITVTSVNDAPVAAGDTASIDEGTATVIDVVANDRDVDEDPLTVISVSAPGHGRAAVASPHEVRYTPSAGFHGVDSFTYTVADPSGATATATVTIGIANVNDAPLAVDDAAATDEDTAVTIDALANDSDPDNDALTILGITAPAHGTATIVDARRIAYAPNANFHGSDQLTYTIGDGHGLEATATIAISIEPVNDAPVAVDDSATTSEDTAIAIEVLANDSDLDEETLAIASVTQPSHGDAVIIDGHITYAPALDFVGTDGFSYAVSDGHGGEATAVVTISVTAVNDSPSAAPDSATVAEDGSIAIDVLANDSDPDRDPLQISTVSPPGHGSVAIDGHNVTYVPAPDFYGADSFSYTVVDPAGAAATAVVSIEVTPVNDAPLAAGDAAVVAEDAAVTIDVVANDSDIETDPLSVISVTAPAHGLALVVNGREVTYVPAPDYNGLDSFAYTISDGSGGQATAEVAIEVAAVNDAPVAVGDAATIDEDTIGTVDVVANDSDVDRDALAVIAIAQPAHGSAVILGDHTIQYVPEANYNGSDALAYTISDGHGGEASATLAIAITPVNDPPVAVDDAAGTPEDTAVALDVVANDIDVDHEVPTIVAITTPAHGTAVIAGGNRILYTPDPDYHGADALQYTISDGRIQTSTATVALDVISVNDAPIAAAVTAATFDDTRTTIALAANDADGDPVTFAIASGPAHGTLEPIAGNLVRYLPAAGFAGADSFTYTAFDGQATSAAATVSIGVTRSQCGNGVREGAHEECDDGNAVAGDGCEATCKLTCGSGSGADRAVVDTASGHCFAAFDGAVNDYPSAAALCAGIGGHLPTITSADEDDAAFSAVHAGDHPWLGGDDIAIEGSFRWTTGETFTAYANFAPGRPDSAAGGDCIQYLSDGTWSDAACRAPAVGTLCEVDFATGTPSFLTGGTGTRAVAVGDLNGDGFADIAAANQTTNTVGVLLGNGIGGFVFQAAYPVAAAPIAVASGDFDGDGRIDLAAINASGTLSVLRGAASGAFVAGPTVAIAANATSIVAGDFNGDGHPDLAVAASVLNLTGVVQVLISNGSGGFSISTSLTLVAVPVALAVGDFDRNGGLDLAITTPVAVLVALSGGGGVLGTPVSVAVTLSNSRAIATNDLDGDGNLDLVVAGTAASATLLFGSPTGVFQASAVLALRAPAQAVAAADFDGDGSTDVAVVSAGIATLFHGSGRTYTASGAPFSTGGGGATAAVIGNVNGDGVADLVVANTDTASAGVLLGGAGGFSAARVVTTDATTSTVTASVAADFNRDGRTDLAIIDSAGGRAIAFMQSANGALVQTAIVVSNVNAAPVALAAADFNVDGILDLAILNTAFGSVAVAFGVGDGTFAATNVVGSGAQPRGVAIADFSGDGKPDMAVAGIGVVSVLTNTGEGRFGRGEDVVATGATLSSIVTGDFNVDGRPDIAFVASTEPVLRVALGLGGSRFSAPTTIALASPSRSLAIADLDGDGRLDLVVANLNTATVSVLLGLGNGGFAAASSLPVGIQPSSVAIADVDGDRRLDIVVGNAGSNDISVLHGNPAGGFVPSTLPVGVAASHVTVADLDRDGHPDFVASSARSFVTTLFSPR